jgi:hypothetical protein
MFSGLKSKKILTLEDGNDTFSRKVGEHLPHDTVQYPRRAQLSRLVQLLESENSKWNHASGTEKSVHNLGRQYGGQNVNNVSEVKAIPLEAWTGL